ncbi:MAG: hypothetical protein DUD34_15165 [Lactobacillus sp.]|jgi:hypothetical protein|nr:MAG: hypothetical protein DUD34_15165 [Lactobacillus sp.]
MTQKLKDEVKEILKNASKSDLNEFVAKLALEDNSVYQQLRRRFGRFSNGQRLSQLKADISDIIAENTWGGFINYHACMAICDELDKVTQEALDMILNGDINVAIQEVLLVIKSVMGFLDKADDSSGAVTGSLDFAFDTLKQLSQASANKLTNPEKRVLVNAAIQVFNLKRFDEWDMYRYEVLENVLPLITINTFKLVESATMKIPERYNKLDHFSDRLYGTGFDSEKFHMTQLEEYNAKLKSKALIAFGEFKAAKQVMAKNIAFNSIRQIAIDFYSSQADFRTAEKLAVNGTLSSKGRQDSNTWLNDLEKIYLKTNEYQKLADVYKKKLLLADWMINLDDYKKLKAVIKKHGNWEKSYPSLLQEFTTKLQSNSYAEILNFEHETGKLMAIVETDPSLIFDYGKSLYAKYPERVTDLYYQDQVNVDIGNTRKQYHQLGEVILKYAHYGNKETARKWCQQLIEQYPRRSALVDEITKINDKIL